MEPIKRQPVFYLTHGGGPCFWTRFPEPYGPQAYEPLKSYFAGLLARLPEQPRAVVVISAHWEEPVTTVSTAIAPPMLYDYYGFPSHTYELQYPARGLPEVGLRVRDLLRAAGIEANTDEDRGFDHGVFVPMLVIDPQARIPVVMVSMRGDLDSAHHLAVGQAVAPLREEGVLIVGSAIGPIVASDGNGDGPTRPLEGPTFRMSPRRVCVRQLCPERLRVFGA